MPLFIQLKTYLWLVDITSNKYSQEMCMPTELFVTETFCKVNSQNGIITYCFCFVLDTNKFNATRSQLLIT